MIDIGPLLAIDLYIHKERVHHRSGCFVLKAFMRHHMAPVAGSISDREQYWLIERLRFLQRMSAPHPPMHGVLRMLQEIGAWGLVKFVSWHGTTALGRGGSMPHQILRNSGKTTKYT